MSHAPVPGCNSVQLVCRPLFLLSVNDSVFSADLSQLYSYLPCTLATGILVAMHTPTSRIEFGSVGGAESSWKPFTSIVNDIAIEVNAAWVGRVPYEVNYPHRTSLQCSYIA